MRKVLHFSKENRIMIAIMLIAACTRLIGLGNFPEGVFPDEAYGAYNTWSLMTEGIDSRGYHNPVYFVAWGSGMNVLYSYLALPLFRIFGVSIFVYRLPQALVSIVSVYASYVLGRELFHKKAGEFMAFLLAINPWSIMNARFGLESTLAPGMVLFAVTFLILGLHKSGIYLLLSSFCFAASLYSYALTWIFIPVFLFLFLLLYWKRIPRKWVTVWSVVLLCIAAIPLLLFLAINMDMMPEIITPFFSVPKLKAFRSQELSARLSFQQMKVLLKTILNQYDGAFHTSSSAVGGYYLFTTPFFVLGIIFHVCRFFKNYKNGGNNREFLLLIWLVAASVVALLQQNVTMVHINLIHIPIVFYGAYGIIQMAQHIRSRCLVPLCLAFFLFSFGYFLFDYSRQEYGNFYGSAAEEALSMAEQMALPDEAITIVGYTTIQCGTWMWFEKPNPLDFSQNVVYVDDPAWGQIGTWGRMHYVYSIDNMTDWEGVYIVPNNTYYQEWLHSRADIDWVEVNKRYFIFEARK